MVNRQQIRKALLILAFLSLPITLFYISPIIIMMGASEGVATGSMVLFIVTFISSLVLGRFWCGWFCPMGGWQEICASVQDSPVTGGKLNLIKYGMWVIWVVLLGITILGAGGIHTIDLFYSTTSGISLTEPVSYGVYLVIMGLIFLVAIIAGKRGMCHYFCPICVNLILGRKIRNLAGWPALHLSGDSACCTGCNKCMKSCPMGLDVQTMVKEGKMENGECILCASCSDACPKGAISYGFR